MKKKLVVCDYGKPQKNFTFPNFGMGSAEKRIWRLAKTVSQWSDFEVIVTGPMWLPEFLPDAKHFKKRLESATINEFLRKYGKADYLFAGSEYFDKDDDVSTFLKAAKQLFSYAGHVYEFNHQYFDGLTKHFFCYSDEMIDLYKLQCPRKTLQVHFGVDEKPYLTRIPQNYLVWMGRIDEDKSPHYAIMAAKKINLPIYVMGKSMYQPDYEKNNREYLRYDNVIRTGVLSGPKKMKIISEALCGVYTIGQNYAEAGAGVLGEMLCSGIPIAGMSWKGNDAVCEAVDNNDLGRIVKATTQMTEVQIVDALAEAIQQCLKLDREKIFKIANEKYDIDKIMRKIFFYLDGNANEIC